MTQDERLMILQMVADKKISASEAAELLRALDGAEAEAESEPATGPKARFAPPPPPSPEAPPTPNLSSLGSGLGSFIEEIVERVSSAFSEVTEPRYEFPSELSGTFTADEVPLRINTGNGRVEIQAWDQPEYKASILVKARGANEAEARVRAQDAYTVKADEYGFELDARRHDFFEAVVHVTLMVPRNKRYRVETRTGNGAVTMNGLMLSEGKAVSGNGRISCIGASDSLLVKTGNGSIEVEGDNLSLEASSGNGSIRIRPAGARPQQIRVTTGNGSAKVDCSRMGPEAGYKVEANTGMGSVGLSLPGMVYDRDVRSMGHKHVIARSANFEQAEVPVHIVARTGLGSITIA